MLLNFTMGMQASRGGASEPEARFVARVVAETADEVEIEIVAAQPTLLARVWGRVKEWFA